MTRIRVIPSLLLYQKGLVKTVKFKNPIYLGDPLNTINIFNKKMVDELILMDITASKEKRDPNYDLIHRISSICFSPLTYGGGISNIKQAEKLFKLGVEKICINTSALFRPDLVGEMAKYFGSQSVIVSLNISRNILGKYKIVANDLSATNLKGSITEIVKYFEDIGAGEIYINDVDRDGTMKGYDTALLKVISSSVNIPVIACGGAGSLTHFREALDEGGVSAVSAGSLFVFNGPHKAVLISYPTQKELRNIFNTTRN